MKKLLLFMFMAFIAVAVSAQDFIWMENSPEKYLPTMTQKVKSLTSPCNKGGEAFINFIAKFKSDPTFRKSRVRMAADDEVGKSSVGVFDGWDILKPGKGTGDGYAYYGTWYSVSTNQVFFKYSEWPTDPDAEWGGSDALFRFQRINSKWYLTGIMLAG